MISDVFPMIAALNARVLDIESARGARERPANSDVIDILVRARALQSSLSTSSRQWTQVAALYQRALELDPSSVTALCGLARALVDSADGMTEDPTIPARYRRADELILQAELLRPDDMRVMDVRVYLLGKQGRYADVIPAAQRAIEAYPNLGGPHVWLGTCLTRTGRAADAIPEFEQAIRLSPRSPEIFVPYLLMGYALLFLGRYDEATAWYQRSLAANTITSAWNRSQNRAAIAAAQALAGHTEEARMSRGGSKSALADAYRPWFLSLQRHQPSRRRAGLPYTGGIAAGWHS